MPDIPYWHIDAFAARPFEGNQAAVLLFDEFPDDAVMQRIGEENNFAETAFVAPCADAKADYFLRWFTPVMEVRLCGHATLASGHAMLRHRAMLGQGGEEVRFATRDAGVLRVRRQGDGYGLALPAIPTQPQPWPEAAAAIGRAPRLVTRHEDGYNIFLFDSEAEVRALSPDMRRLGAMGDHQFICTAPGETIDIVSRVFVPDAGVDEDSVTGSAHAALTPFWAERLGRSEFTAFQASRRGGHLTCRLEGDKVWLGGPCVTVVTGRFSF